MKNESAEKPPRPDSELNLGDRLESARSIINGVWSQLNVLKKRDAEDHPCPKPSGQTIEQQLSSAYDIIDDLWRQLQIENLRSKNSAPVTDHAHAPTSGTLADFEEKMKQAKTPQARAAIAADFEKAVKGNRIAYSGNSAGAPATTSSVADFEEKMKQAKTPQARAAVAAEFERSITGK